jgi:predicted porin
MQKKLLAVAVAGVLAAPVTAMAQSSVSISGYFKAQIDRYSISDVNPARTPAGANTSENRVSDGASRILFNVTEDIGGGMQGVAQLDVRFNTEQANPGVSTNKIAEGNTWVGLRGASWGTVSLGRFDLHYGKQPDDIAAKAGSLMASSNALMSFAGGGATAIANATRTQNVIRYDTPNWGGFTLTAAYSTNPSTQENDLTSTAKKGYGANLNPQFVSGPFGAGWSTWKSRADAGALTGITAANGFTPPAAPTTQAEQTGNILYGWYTAPFGLKVGLAIDWSKIDTITIATGTSATTSKRTAFSIPVSWTTGPHTVYATYTKAKDDTATTADDGARLIALAYNFDLSKRTSVGVTYVKLNNNPGAAYNMFTNSTAGFGSMGSPLQAGEDATLWAVAMRHNF